MNKQQKIKAYNREWKRKKYAENPKKAIAQSKKAYEKIKKDPEKLKEYFNDIPFLNGGLFECLDDKRDKPYLYVDGFTATKKNQPIVPNFLFFSDEQDIDLNTEYGTKKKKYKVRGLIDTLSSYNFYN